MDEIDRSDILGYLKLLAYRSGKEHHKKNEPVKTYIDLIWPATKQ